ncbi:hypothetical protein AC481_06410 [miscellaneous Crenarchaeota group archaeon SMTZ-80]|nr:MAG: hypothetical protein AC481_06410 [miscellaneous Crenarchaeota group archaeon SMTZ-80]
MSKFSVVLLVNSPIGSTYGLNIIVAQLKSIGAEVRVLYLAEITAMRVFSQSIMSVEENTPGCLKFTNSVVEQVLEFCREASIIGFSLMTAGFFNSVQLTQRIKESLGDIPVVWGGKHVIINPEECLEYADVLCTREGDTNFKEYIQNMMGGDKKRDIPGLWFKDGNIRNHTAPYIRDLVTLPFPDYGPSGHYLIENGLIREATHEDIRKYLLKEYPTMIARGCPMKCTFCANSAEDNHRLRVRSVDNVIAELDRTQKDYGNIQMVMFRDDTIMSLKLEYIEEFSTKWKEKLNIPFSSSGVIPTAVKEDKLRLLLNAGFFSVKMGIQSGSIKVRNKIYGRPESDEQVMRAANILNKLNTPKVAYMFITDNPWEEDDDIVTSLRFISRLSRPFSLSIYSLNLYPGTELFNRAIREGKINNPHEWYNKSTMTLKKSYFNMLYMMQRFWAVPSWMMTILTWKFLYRKKTYQFIFTKCYGWYFRNLSQFGVERKSIKCKTIFHVGIELFIDIFFRLDVKTAKDKIINKIRASNRKMKYESAFVK